ncbi:MAG TPA: hypothetical protein VIY73_20980 [Polyangiaceae bacterium]
MAYPTGHLPDHPAVIAARAGLHLHPEYGAMRVGTMPLKTTNRAKLATSQGGPGILDQHDTSSCEGHAHASGITLSFANAGTPLPEVVSPVGLYLGALMVDAVPNRDGTLPPLVDQGTMPSSILGGLLLYGGVGASVWGQYPASSATMYLPGTTTSQLIQPSPTQLFGERAFRLNGAYFLTTSGASLVRDVYRVHASGRVLTNAIPASGADFQGYGGGVLGALSGDVDHAQLFADSEWTGTQAQLDAFMAGDDSLLSLYLGHGVNSWGATWGEVDALNGLGGQYRADANYVQQAQDWCVLSLARVS